ncbi:aminopeptidase N-like [Schistocerca cancellata]|uniref:aminopeptidase N-like n=1 Tax=Schistocerca cancellata TaxID=274614 RepID=UPI0021196B63|nr:aminopeptidase N-like [Schistocerca cancellata]
MYARRLLVLLVAASTSSSWGQDHGPPGQETTVARLPLEAVPYHYELELAPYFQPEGDFQALDVDGQVTIHVEVQASQTDTITLHAGDSVTIDPADIRVRSTAEDGSEQELTVDDATRDWDTEMVNISLGTQLSGELSLVVPFRSRLRTDMDGFYLSEYQAGGQTRYLAATQFAPMSARKAFPCFDEPALKANFSVTLYPPTGYGALSNGALDSAPAAAARHSRRTLPAAESRSAVTFETTRPMPTYLVGVVVYDTETFTADERPESESWGALRVWSRQDTADQRGLAQDVAAAALDYLGGLFPDFFRYMVPKMDQVAVPDFYFGAMENWGLVTYRERALLADEAESSVAAQRYAVTTMAHELAHQWFGDLVTPDFWNVLWLKEGFATYWAYHTDLGLVTDCWGLREHFLVEQMAIALDADASESTHALTSAPDTAALYDDISYSKGGSILRMFSNWLGEDQFNKALNTYLLNRMYSSALPEELFAAIAEEGYPELADYMETWTTTPGFPVINVTREGQNATLTQARYLLKRPENSTYSTPWPSLISYVVGTDFQLTATKSVWVMGEESTTIDGLATEEPLFLNLNWTGFFRINYDTASWRLIQEQLTSNHLAVPRETRAQLVSDVFSLARSDHLDYELALNFSLYLYQEEDYLPWAIAFRIFDYLDTFLISTEHYPAFQSYVKSLLERFYWTLTFSARPDDDHMTRSLRAGVGKWLCRVHDSSCLNYAWQLAQAASSPSDANVDPDMRAAVYCVWATDNARWEALWQHYLQTTVATEKQEVLSALGCSQDEAKLNTYLGYTLEKDKIKPQDAQTVFTSVCTTPMGVKVATDFIVNNTEAFAQGRYAEKIISGLAKRVTTEEQLTQLQSLQSLEALQKINATVDSAISAATAQVEWADSHINTIGSWLEGGNFIPSSTSRISYNMMAIIPVISVVLLSSSFCVF